MKNLDHYIKRQIELVEFGEKVYHKGLRHKGLNGSLYEDVLIKYLREDIPQLSFFKGQIHDEDEIISPQYDIIICKKDTPQADFLKGINQYVNVVSEEDCLGVIELKKWANPKMISFSGTIYSAYQKIKENYPRLKYVFVCFRFKDSKKKVEERWNTLSTTLSTDARFCLWGNVYDEDKEWKFPWLENDSLINRNQAYLGEYKKLVDYILGLDILC